jgi:hypothetical protein
MRLRRATITNRGARCRTGTAESGDGPALGADPRLGLSDALNRRRGMLSRSQVRANFRYWQLFLGSMYVLRASACGYGWYLRAEGSSQATVEEGRDGP